MKANLDNLGRFSVKKWYEMQLHMYVSWNQFSTKVGNKHNAIKPTTTILITYASMISLFKDNNYTNWAIMDYIYMNTINRFYLKKKKRYLRRWLFLCRNRNLPQTLCWLLELWNGHWALCFSIKESQIYVLVSKIRFIWRRVGTICQWH